MRCSARRAQNNRARLSSLSHSFGGDLWTGTAWGYGLPYAPLQAQDGGRSFVVDACQIEEAEVLTVWMWTLRLCARQPAWFHDARLGWDGLWQEDAGAGSEGV